MSPFSLGRIYNDNGPVVLIYFPVLLNWHVSPNDLFSKLCITALQPPYVIVPILDLQQYLVVVCTVWSLLNFSKLLLHFISVPNEDAVSHGLLIYWHKLLRDGS